MKYYNTFQNFPLHPVPVYTTQPLRAGRGWMTSLHGQIKMWGMEIDQKLIGIPQCDRCKMQLLRSRIRLREEEEDEMPKAMIRGSNRIRSKKNDCCNVCMLIPLS